MFTGLKLTNDGMTLLMALLAGHTVQFTNIKMGDGTAPDDITTMTDLVNVKQNLPINRVKAVDISTILAGANLMGNDVTEGFYWKEVGLFAKDLTAGTPEMMFSYDNAGDVASYIPAGGTVTEMLIDLLIKINNSENINIVLDESLVFVTQADLTGTITTLQDDYNDKIGTVTTNLNTHINNVSNPHSVTKAQVGLGNVDNYGTATTAEATAGSSTSKFMTPVRTKEAVTAYGAITDGNVIIKISATQPTAQSGKTIIWINTAS